MTLDRYLNAGEVLFADFDLSEYSFFDSNMRVSKFEHAVHELSHAVCVGMPIDSSVHAWEAKLSLMITRDPDRAPIEEVRTLAVEWLVLERTGLVERLTQPKCMREFIAIAKTQDVAIWDVILCTRLPWASALADRVIEVLKTRSWKVG
jgi:hypothetical protein